MTTVANCNERFTNNARVVYWSDEEKHLKQVLRDVESNWETNKSAFPELMKWIKAMQDLANLYLKQGDLKQAFYHFITPHNWVVNQLHRQDLSQDDITTTIHVLRMTFEPLYNFSLIHPCCDKCRKNLEETRQMLAQAEYQVH